jgi:hypothetical protein
MGDAVNNTKKRPESDGKVLAEFASEHPEVFARIAKQVI